MADTRFDIPPHGPFRHDINGSPAQLDYASYQIAGVLSMNSYLFPFRILVSDLKSTPQSFNVGTSNGINAVINLAYDHETYILEYSVTDPDRVSLVSLKYYEGF